MWRRFQFFDKKPLEASKELSRLSCPSSTAGVGPGGVRLFFFASENGTSLLHFLSFAFHTPQSLGPFRVTGLVYIADVQLKLVSAFRSHDVRCTFVKCLNRVRRAGRMSASLCKQLRAGTVAIFDFNKQPCQQLMADFAGPFSHLSC